MAAHCYNNLGQLVKKTLGGDLHSSTYRYNIRGWLTQTNWNHKGQTSQSYVYKYDELNRIEKATHNTGNYTMAVTDYDKNGNIRNLERMGAINDSGKMGMMDQLVYSYVGNQLLGIAEGASNAKGFTSKTKAANQYRYDVNGNMIQDLNKGITSINYNHLNLPKSIAINGSNINYQYDASGVKLKKTVIENRAQIYIKDVKPKKPTNGQTIAYTGSTVYKNDVLEFIHMPEGYIEPTNNGYEYIYRLTDHLGNTRVSFKKNKVTNEIDVLDTNDYYPFGLEHQKARQGASSSNLGQNWKYQGQERTPEMDLNIDEWKYRVSDPAIGRFWQIDPLAEDYVYNSTYAFAENRVIDGFELEGLEWKSIKDDDTGNTKLQLTIQLYNDSSLSSEKLNDRVEAMKTQFAESYSGEGFTGELVVNTVTEAKGDFLVKVTDNTSTTVTKADGTTVTRKVNGSAPGALKSVNTQASSDKSTVRINIAGTMDGSNKSKNAMARTFSHEAGHTGGLRHTHDAKNTISDVNQNTLTVTNKTLIKNLMNSGSSKSNVPSTSGTTLTKSQLKSVDKIVRQQQ